MDTIDCEGADTGDPVELDSDIEENMFVENNHDDLVQDNVSQPAEESEAGSDIEHPF